MDWVGKLVEKIEERCPDLSSCDLDSITDIIRDRVQPLIEEARNSVRTGKTSDLETEVSGFHEASFPESLGDWVFERSSGYAGFRCLKCAKWMYAHETKRCNCDKVKQ